MDINIVFKCGNYFLIFQNSFYIKIFYLSYYTRKGGLGYLMTNYFWAKLFLCNNLNYFKVIYLLFYFIIWIFIFSLEFMF
jgi:hypothetical protein